MMSEWLPLTNAVMLAHQGGVCPCTQRWRYWWQSMTSESVASLTPNCLAGMWRVEYVKSPMRQVARLRRLDER